MAEDVETQKLPALVTTTDYFDALVEEHNLEDKLRVIYNFEIQYKKTTSAPETGQQNTEDPFILYISGSDSRSKILADATRSDVNMLAVINPKQHKILLVSIPRDYYVQLHSTTGTRDKLTHAGVYGIDMSRTTIEDLLDVKIAHTVKVGFPAVENTVNAIDGIEIYSDQAFTARTNKTCNYVVGTQHVDGACALAFARERKAYSSSDHHRVQDQQAVLTAIIAKALQKEYITRYTEILDATSSSLKTSLSYNDLTSLARTQLKNMASWEVESINLDGTGSRQPTYSMGNRPLYVMLPDQNSINQAKTKISAYLAN